MVDADIGVDSMDEATPKAVSVLFVCLGNICRSPMAEAVFRTASASNPRISQVDSAGTGAYHTGDGPDPRTMRTLEKNGITGYWHAARKVTPSDFTEFDFVLAMDEDNLQDLQRSRQRAHRKSSSKKGQVRLFGDFGGRIGEEVVDPYYGANDGFEIAFEQMTRFSQGFIKYLTNEEEAQSD